MNRKGKARLVAAVIDVLFFSDTATTEIYTLSLHDALPIWSTGAPKGCVVTHANVARLMRQTEAWLDRKSTRLNSSHSQISYAVFCLKKKKHQQETETFDFFIRPQPKPLRHCLRRLIPIAGH